MACIEETCIEDLHRGALAEARVLLVGLGGLGTPAALALARSGVGAMTLLDDDRVSLTNLHRQILFEERDVGALKVEVAAARLRAEAEGRGHATPRIEVREERLLPDTALALLEGHDLVIEGADNFATKFLAADACAIARVPLVQAGAVRWSGWALASVPGASRCLRCVFEDIPHDRVETCAEAGVIGPVVGALGALLAALAIRLLLGDPSAAGELWHLRGLAGALRRSAAPPRLDCPLCGGEIRSLGWERYAPPVCA